ncbi:MAG: hypothetical protein KF870_04435 [Leadbetterella sp.]|nr:hypothetical protein [Leadbetterella sp.]
MRNAIYIILPLAFISMVVGIYCGIIRVGQPLPSGAYLPVAHHGVLMAGSFLGTLICLERMVTFPDKRAWAGVILMALSLPLFIFNLPQYGVLSLLTGSTGYSWISVSNYRKYKLKGDLIMAVGSVFQVIAYIIFFFTYSYPRAFAAWLLFLILTIVGERLNLTRFLPVSKKAFYEAYFWLGLLLLSSFLYHFGLKVVVGLSMIGLAQWLLRNDIVRINLQKQGHYHFVGLALLLAYLWLAVTGVLSMREMGNPYLYDAVLHSFFVGFVLSMILAHAPIIFPGILGIKTTPFHPVMYVWLMGLHASLIIRIYGDMTENFELRKLGGIYNGVFFLIYILTVMGLIIKFKRSKS